MVALIPRLRGQARLSRLECALPPRTRSGRQRGRPGPRRRIRKPSSTTTNIGLSPRWPGEVCQVSGTIVLPVS